MDNKIDLIRPISELYHIKSLDEVVFNQKVSEYLKDTYSLDERKNIHQAIVNVEQKPNHDFKDLMREVPKPQDLSFSNEEIFSYLLSFKTFMENEEFDLLIDSRPPKDF